MIDIILKTNNLTKKYNGIPVVDNVSITINSGDIYGFVGRNGAGKTTVIRLITGIIRKSGGSFALYGVNDNDGEINNARKNMAAIVEAPSIYTNFNGYDNLLMQMKLLGRKDYNAIDEVLNLVGLDKVANGSKKSKNYSLGMKQRLGIAMCLISNPNFLILDEPTNGLDPEGIIEIRELLLKLNKEKQITIFISSHILSELSKIATKYGFINEGKLIQEISATELVNYCNKSINLQIIENKEIKEVLKKIGILNYKISGCNVNIYDEIDITPLITMLSQNDVYVKKANVIENDLEKYFVDLIGGKG